MLNGYSITVDAGDTGRLADFWAAAMGYPPARRPAVADGEPGSLSAAEIEDPGSWRTLSDPDGKLPTIFFQRVPETKTAKNRFHLDLDVGGSGSKEERRRASTPRPLASSTSVPVTTAAPPTRATPTGSG